MYPNKAQRDVRKSCSFQEQTGSERGKKRDEGRVTAAQQTTQLQGLLHSPYLVTSGAVVGRTCFMMVWIQLRRMPEVMAERVNSPSFVYREIKNSSEQVTAPASAFPTAQDHPAPIPKSPVLGHCLLATQRSNPAPVSHSTLPVGISISQQPG